jgi:hypothetical protein
MIVPPEVEEFVAPLTRSMEALEAENAELRRRLKKKRRLSGSLRRRTGKRSGGRKGHRGDTLREAAEPDAIIERAAERCAHCQARLFADSNVGEEKRNSATPSESVRPNRVVDNTQRSGHES